MDPSLLQDWIHKETQPKFYRLNEAIVQLIEDFNMVQFLPCNIKDEDSLALIFHHMDVALQYGEQEEPKEPPLRDIDE